MPWKFVCDLRFHEILQTTIRQITKENEEIKKYSQKQLELYACVGYSCISLCVDV